MNCIISSYLHMLAMMFVIHYSMERMIMTKFVKKIICKKRVHKLFFQDNSTLEYRDI